MSIAASIAKKLATVMIRTSRLAMCESSWARTPSTSFGSSRFQRPVVTQTAACFGERPVANAFGHGRVHDRDLRLRQVGDRAQPLDHVVQRGRLLAAHDLRAGGGEGDLVGGVVLEQRDADHDQQHRREADVEEREQDDGEDDVQQAEQARREEHPEREAGIAAV